MIKSDFVVIIIVLAIITPFVIFDAPLQYYYTLNHAHPLILAFVKFALLATFGEMLGMRIKCKTYYTKEFGIIPKGIVWGFLGMWIAIAMGVFSMGIPIYLSQFETFALMPDAMSGFFSGMKLLGAFAISLMMNLSFAPVFMTLHKVTDAHILFYKGSFLALIKPIKFANLLKNLDWNTHWNFVLKKSIPFFWIPAHTITFLLPHDWQVLFAAFCSIILGLILSMSSVFLNKK
ncbi:MAG: hypothetical protein LBU51_02735 [Bacteroidales bacterium]|jgi:hypothetical protein|nr:hypothetical protein [Bacteroidales bacterium]